MIVNDRKDWILKTKISNDNIALFKDHTDTLIKNLNAIDLEQKSTRGSLSKQYDLWHYDIDVINKYIIPILKKNFENYDFLNASAWTVYGEEYGYHMIHNHGQGHLKSLDENANIKDICTVTYLRVPEPNLYFSGDIFFVLRDSNNELEAITISPEVGDMFIFPSHLLHGTYPQPKGTRQTLNLDYTPFLKKQ